jgi:ubiquinone/menaquinone biosynthesis C-methylase UbiE
MASSDAGAPAAREVWSAAAGGWDARYDWYAQSIQPLTDWFCRTVASPGARVLDLASGTGQPALAIARRIQPGGRVVATDLSPAMIQILDRRARESCLDNVDALEMDAQELRFAGHTFDAVSCACGLMFCPDPARVAREIRRVLVPRGRFAIAVWDEASRNPFFTVAGRAVATILPAAPTDPAPRAGRVRARSKPSWSPAASPRSPSSVGR